MGISTWEYLEERSDVVGKNWIREEEMEKEGTEVAYIV